MGATASTGPVDQCQHVSLATSALNPPVNRSEDSTMPDKRLSGTGIWSGILRYGDPGEAAALAAELEALGFSALWIPDIGGDVFTPLDNLLGATRTSTIATGILNVWMHTPEATAAGHARLTAEHGPRFLCGLGISHRPFIDHVNKPGTYAKPIQTMSDYLDGLDAAPTPLATRDRIIAALGPKMLELARTRTAGTHPYLVTPELTHAARAGVGPDGLVASEQGVVLETDPIRAREIARLHLQTYLGLPNYTNNWKRQGFTDDDIAGGGSDRLVDALVVWGDEATIAARVQAHRDAGADHVCIQVLTEDPRAFPVDQWRALAHLGTNG
jgi:probable F420-dependent oxidoreductase